MEAPGPQSLSRGEEVEINREGGGGGTLGGFNKKQARGEGYRINATLTSCIWQKGQGESYSLRHKISTSLTAPCLPLQRRENQGRDDNSLVQFTNQTRNRSSNWPGLS